MRAIHCTFIAMGLKIFSIRLKLDVLSFLREVDVLVQLMLFGDRDFSSDVNRSILEQTLDFKPHSHKNTFLFVSIFVYLYLSVYIVNMQLFVLQWSLYSRCSFGLMFYVNNPLG